MVNHARINMSTSNGFELQTVPTESTKTQNQVTKQKKTHKKQCRSLDNTVDSKNKKCRSHYLKAVLLMVPMNIFGIFGNFYLRGSCCHLVTVSGRCLTGS